MKQSLNEKVFNDLHQKIKTNYYKEGEKLPTEKELQQHYGMSRAPIRQALGRLQSEGFIERKPGIGSVVIRDVNKTVWPSVGGFSTNLGVKWKDLRCMTIEVVNIVAELDVIEKLKPTEDDQLTRVKRVRFDQDVPVFLLNNYYKNVDKNKIKEAGEILNMRQFANKVLGLDLVYVNEQIRSVRAEEHTSHYLQVPLGHPLLEIKRTSYNLHYEPVEYVVYYVNSEKWPYSVSYGPMEEGGMKDD